MQFPNIETHVILKYSSTLICLYAIIKFVSRLLKLKRYNLPPGPCMWPFIGQPSMFEYQKLYDHKDKYGDISYLKVFGQSIVVLNSAEAIRSAVALNNGEAINDRPTTFLNQYITYDDIIFTSPYNDWKRFKHQAHIIFKQHGKGIEKLESIVSTELEKFIAILRKNIDKDIDIDDFLQSLIINIIAALIYGTKYEYNDQYMQKVKRVYKLGETLLSPYIDGLLTTFPWLRHIHFCGLGKIVKETIDLRNEIFSDKFYNCKKIFSNRDLIGEGIAYDVLRLQNTEKWLTDEKAIGMIHNLYSAGIFTTTKVLYSFILIMVNYPEIQERIQIEIDSTVGKSRRVDLKDRENMHYTQACILEVLRFAPALPLSLPHFCPKSVDFYGYTIPSKTVVLLNLFRVHFDPDIWKNPWEFQPLRFLDETGKLLSANSDARKNLFTFGIGKRLCVAEVFAKHRLFLIISYLLQSYSLHSSCFPPPSCDPRDYKQDFALFPNSYKIILKERK